MVNTSAIHRVIGTARRRLRTQAALEWASSAAVVAAGGVLLIMLVAWFGWIPEPTLQHLLIGAGAIVFIGATIGATRSHSQNSIATKVDRSSGLSDRLATACAFEAKLAAGQQDLDKDTRAMMQLAIADAVRAVPKADPKAATPFATPKRAKPALLLALFAGLTFMLPKGHEIQRPSLAQLLPAAGLPGATIAGVGRGLLSPSGKTDTVVFLGEGEAALTATIQSLSTAAIEFEIPANAPVGMTTIVIRVGSLKTAPLPFEVLDKEDPRAIPEENIVLDEEDLDFVRDLVSELRKTSESNEDLALEELANKLDKLLDQAEKGEVNKKQLLEALNKAEEKYMEGSEEAVQESLADLKKAGQELKKDKLTKALGKALEKGQLEQARAEMEKLAKQLENNSIDDKQAKKLGKAMEKAAEKMAKAQEKRDAQMQKQMAKKKEGIRKLEKKRDEARTKREREEMVRRLEREKRELRRLQRKKEAKQKDASKRELKQLRRKMSEAAKELQKKQQKQNRQKSRRQVSKTMREMAQRTGKVSKDQRKMANKAKVVTQMSDLKEAMRRAKRKGKQGAKNPFGRNAGRKKDFGSRARGGQGQKGAWKPGQGKGKGKGQGKGGKGQGKGGQGKQPGGDEHGEGHDPNVMGDPTKMAGNTTDESLQGVRGKGPSTRETILTSAQKGFASRAYQEVFVKYKTIVEEVIKAEKVPSGYKHYVQRYFHKIKPVN